MSDYENTGPDSGNSQDLPIDFENSGLNLFFESRAKLETKDIILNYIYRKRYNLAIEVYDRFKLEKSDFHDQKSQDIFRVALINTDRDCFPFHKFDILDEELNFEEIKLLDCFKLILTFKIEDQLKLKKILQNFDEYNHKIDKEKLNTWFENLNNNYELNNEEYSKLKLLFNNRNCSSEELQCLASLVEIYNASLINNHKIEEIKMLITEYLEGNTQLSLILESINKKIKAENSSHIQEKLKDLQNFILLSCTNQELIVLMEDTLGYSYLIEKIEDTLEKVDEIIEKSKLSKNRINSNKLNSIISELANLDSSLNEFRKEELNTNQVKLFEAIKSEFFTRIKEKLRMVSKKKDWFLRADHSNTLNPKLWSELLDITLDVHTKKPNILNKLNDWLYKSMDFLATQGIKDFNWIKLNYQNLLYIIDEPLQEQKDQYSFGIEYRIEKLKFKKNPSLIIFRNCLELLNNWFNENNKNLVDKFNLYHCYFKDKADLYAEKIKLQNDPKKNS